MLKLSHRDDHASPSDHRTGPRNADEVGHIPPIRLSVQRWGIARDTLRAMVDTLNAADRRIVWSDHNDGGPTDLIVHMVDLEGLAGPSLQAPWNLLGPVEALRAAREQGVAAVVLAEGEARHLPMVRTGCWITSSSCSLVTAVRILAGAAIIDASEVDANARCERLATLASRNVLARVHRVVAASPATLASSVRTLINSAQRDGCAAMSYASIGVASDVDLEVPPSSTPTQVLCSQLANTEADLLLAYPWPDLSSSAGKFAPP
ncbi:hypothetical protein [Cupriavidus nantongensis]|uniref:hypothetical protein n=1 Tax=Cupriavidus nantongensis TaxID=1796606 RepID=UPI00358E2504